MMKSILRNLQSKLWLVVSVPILVLGIGASTALINVVDMQNSGQAKILGDHPTPFQQWEEKLQGEILRNDGPEEIFAFLTSQFSGLIIRVRGGRAKIYSQGPISELYREMTDLELEKLRAFINERSIDDLKSDIPGGNHVHLYEYLHLKKEGGRRVIIGTSPLPFIESIEIYKFFSQFVKSDGLKVRYEIMDYLKEVEALPVDVKDVVRGVCTSNGSIQVLLAQRGALSTREVLASVIGKDDLSSSEWRYFSQGRLGDKVKPSAICPIISAIDENVPEDLPRIDGQCQADQHQTWQARVKNGTILGADLEQISGLWKFSAGHKPQLLATGPYFSPITTPDGKWVVAAKGIAYRGDRVGLIRISLETGRQYKIDLPNIPDTWEGVDEVEPVAFVPAHNKILIRLPYAGSALPLEGENFLLDPTTGLGEKVSGEFSPLTQQSYRPLQPTGRPNEFWAAVPREWMSPTEGLDKDKNYTEVGRYNTKSFVFIPLIKFPKMMFDSMQIWVDEAEDKIYLAYNGHLLQLSLQQ